MVTDIHLSDPTFSAPARPGIFHRAACHFIRDERDVPFIKLALLLSCTIVPAGLALFIPGVFTWWAAVPYFAAYAWMLGPYNLMLHNTSHRRLFKPKYELLNHWIPTVLAPFFGETPETYYAHHIGMHHPENNLPEDLSSTMAYDRASFRSFMAYFLRFFFGIMPELTVYMARRKRRKLIRRMLIGEFSAYALYGVALVINWRAGLLVFVIPFVFTRFMMMAGNWGQHAFVSADDPGNSLLNSITCINTTYNRRCFNDGYHIGHHVSPNRHWTDMPADFLRSRQAYAEAGSIVFEGLDFFMVWALLMTKRWNVLARHVVQLGETNRPLNEVVELLKARTRPIRARSDLGASSAASAAA